MLPNRVIASVLLSAEEERRLKRLSRGQPLSATLLRLARKDVQVHGAAPAVVAAGVACPVARKLSVSLPAELIEGVDARRGSASYGAYLRSLLGVSRDEPEALPPGPRVVSRAARPLRVGHLDELAMGGGGTMELVEFVADIEELEDRWSESYWTAMAPGEAGWLLLGLPERAGPSVLTSREDGEVAFGTVRRLFRYAACIVRIVLRPSFVFRRHVRGRRLGEAR